MFRPRGEYEGVKNEPGNFYLLQETSIYGKSASCDFLDDFIRVFYGFLLWDLVFLSHRENVQADRRRSYERGGRGILHASRPHSSRWGLGDTGTGIPSEKTSKSFVCNQSSGERVGAGGGVVDGTSGGGVGRGG